MSFPSCLFDIRSSINSEYMEGDVVALKNRLALENIALEETFITEGIQELKAIQSDYNSRMFSTLLHNGISGPLEDEFSNIKFYKDVVNIYYDSLEEEAKIKFIKNLNCGTTHGEETIEKLLVFKSISDDRKYDYIYDNTKAMLLTLGLVGEEKREIEWLIDLYEKDDFDQNEDILYILKSNKKYQTFEGYDFSNEEFEKLLSNTDKRTRNSEKTLIAILDKISSESKIKYLEQKPEFVDYIINSLSENEIKAFFETIDDDYYKAKLLISSNLNATQACNFFEYIQDDYIKTQIVFSRHEDIEQANDESLEKIKKYLEFKEGFINVSPEERVKLLVNMHNNQTTEEVTETYKDYNEIKKGLLKYIENSEDRKKVIDSMPRYVSPEIAPYTDLVQNMIIDYFESNGGLSEDMRERMEVVFNSTDVFFSNNLRNSDVNGDCSYINQRIRVAERFEGDIEDVLLILAHEYSHAMSKYNWRTTQHHMGDTIEEGMADTFSEQVVNKYFEKNPTLEFNGEAITLALPLLNISGYKYENGIVKTMLYPLSTLGKDVEAIKQYLLGDKNEFLDITLGKGFSDRFEKNYAGEPVEVDFAKREIYEAHENTFEVYDKDSLYSQRNFLTPIFVIEKRTSGKSPDSFFDLESGESFNENFINNTYFDRRKLYEIPAEEYAEFMELYNEANSSERIYFSGIERYVDQKFGELEAEEIAEHSTEILSAAMNLLINTPNIGDAVSNVLKAALEHELESVGNASPSEELEQANKLNEAIHGINLILKEGNSRGTTAIRNQFVEAEEFYKKRVDNLEMLENLPIMGENWFVGKPNMKNPIGERICNEAQIQEVRFGEVSAACFAFERDQKVLENKSKGDIDETDDR